MQNLLTKHDFQKAARQLGEDVAGLILTLPLPQEVKQAWADTAPQMELYELNNAIEILNLHTYKDIQEKVEDVQRRYTVLIGQQ